MLCEKSDARLFEIISFCILRSYYLNKTIFWGITKELVKEEKLELFKTGRTNANDGGIDFVMKPSGRFFQVSETTDLKKYFLDIDKIKKFPITFVIKSTKADNVLKSDIKNEATQIYSDIKVLSSFMSCIEEVISLPKLYKYFEELIASGQCHDFLNEIIVQSKMEFHLEE